jgi:3-phenylpropionate/trans-cinnamate dioxygenase ferredoxin component
MNTKSDSAYIPVCRLDELKPSQPKTIELDDRFIVLVRLGDDVFCLEDVCTHDGGTLGDGELDEHCLVCPRHGAKFDVRTGEAVTMPATEPTRSYEVKVDQGMVLVKCED